MKKYLERSLNRRNYEAPKVEVIAIESQGILCASAEGGSRGGTETMNLTEVNWP
jgi:hypothetical protein